jgi:tricorn protease
VTRGYLRFPHIAGELLTFVAEDDVWLAPASGGKAWRLTTDNVPVSRPRLSPDRQRVAWTSTRDGAPEAHIVELDGGRRRRLTYFGVATTIVLGWTRDGRVIVATHGGGENRKRRAAYAVGLEGGPPERLPYGYVSNVALAPGGAVLAATAGTVEVAWWKRYRGGTAPKLWLDRNGEGSFERLFADERAPLESPLWLDDGATIGFVSDRDGESELWAATLPADRLPAVDDLRKLTGTASGGSPDNSPFYVRHATSDGRRAVFQRGGELWRWDGDVETPIEIELGGERRATMPQPIDASHHLGAISPAVDGRASAVEVRGTVSWLTHRDGPVRALASGSSVRRRLPVVLASGGDVAWITDAAGDDAVEVWSAGDETIRTIVPGGLGRVLELAASPDGALLAGASHDGRLWAVTVSTGDLREVDRTTNGDVSGLTFSPDSRWLAWSHPGRSPLAQIRVAEVAAPDAVPIDVTPLRFADTAPAFSTDGKYLAFLSTRSFDPIYDAYVFDLSFPNGNRPQLVALAATTPSPFDPDVAGRVPAPPKDAGTAELGAPVVAIDPAGLDQRVVPFPVPAARYSSLRAVSGGFAWLRAPITGELGDDLPRLDAEPPRSALEHFGLTSRRVEVLVEAVDRFVPTGDGSRLVVVDKHELKVVPADRKVSPEEAEKSDDAVTVDLSRLRVTVTPADEWRQMYGEAGRLMRDHYFRADMGGIDWDATLGRYAPLLERLGSTDDLVDVLWEVQGELGTSHAYVNPPPPEQTRSQGMLGADLAPDSDGRWAVARILPGDPSDPRARSPLTAPGVAVTIGDVILAVDGHPVDPRWGPAEHLVDTAGKPVALTVESTTGERRNVVVTPLADETPLRYQAWVADRRAFTHERSAGRLGYLHVPDMMSPGWAQLHRDLRFEMGRDGLIVDLRFNAGGHTSQLVVEKLARRIIGWDRSRGYEPESYPIDAPRGPVVTVIDEQAGSDGDIAAAAIKILGLGPVVGTRTWGGVVGIDGRYQLVDGTSVTQPRYAFWLEGYEWGVENRGVDPEIEVQRTPADIAAGRDPQLERAIDIALDGLADRPPKIAPDLPTV